jgi:hypothetical protein
LKRDSRQKANEELGSQLSLIFALCLSFNVIQPHDTRMKTCVMMPHSVKAALVRQRLLGCHQTGQKFRFIVKNKGYSVVGGK